ncbi:MAG: serine/threonine protein kinase [Planctomycetes bacterium]|nr:serine/threonine protein kinase [Planctomycetota bacterium]
MTDFDESSSDVLGSCIEEILDQGLTALERLVREHPDLEAVLRKRVSALVRLGLLEGTESESVPTILGDYVLLERIGHGGMGTVYLAESRKLGRRVALKAIRPEQLYFAGARERFRREIAAIARLQVPGVVPILDVGEADGVPYYVMELLDGVDLAVLIRRLAARGVSIGESGSNAFHEAADWSANGEAPVELFEGGHLRVCARIVSNLARTLGHVHAHGIVHRDVKPSNVIVDRFGRVTLVDFGLAHLAQFDELTRSGALLGSLPYMAPEQIRGERAAIDERTDVYGAGITLHELVFTRPAFDVSDPVELRHRICAGLERRKSSSRDLDTILERATDPDPARRYASADAFADDLARYLDRRPVLARPSGLLVRGHRYAQRHPGRASAIALIALFSTVTPSVIAVERASAARALSASLVEAERQKDNYENALTGALDVLRSTTIRLVTDEDIAEDGTLDPARREAIEKAVAFYEGLRVRDPDNEDIRRAMVIGKFRQAELLMTLGEYERALTVSDTVLLLTDGDMDAARLRFDTRMFRGGIQNHLGNLEGCEQEWIAAREDLGKIELRSIDDRIKWGRALHARSIALATRREPAAVDAARESLTWFESVLADSDADHEIEAAGYVAMARRVLASVVDLRRESTEPYEILQTAIRDLEALLEKDPDDRSCLSELATTRHELGNAYRYALRDDQALPHLEQAADARRVLARRLPDRARNTRELASTLSALGSVLHRLGKHDRAEPVLREGIALIERRMQGARASATLRLDLATLKTWLAMSLQALGRPFEEWDDLHAEAIRLHEELLENDAAREIEHRSGLGAARINAASSRFQAGRHDAALELLAIGIRDFERVLELRPEDGLIRKQIGRACQGGAAMARVAAKSADVVLGYLDIAVRHESLTIDDIDAMRDALGGEVIDEFHARMKKRTKR